jgi:hypothetical protein
MGSAITMVHRGHLAWWRISSTSLKGASLYKKMAKRSILYKKRGSAIENWAIMRIRMNFKK